MTRTALYPGSFDPVTNGHLDMVRAACRITDTLVLAIGVQAAKVPMFTADERAAMLEEECAPIAKAAKVKIKVITFDNLVVEAARKNGATLLIKGLRDGTDLDYEMQMAGMNGTMAPNVQTVFLPASPEVRHITATLVRQIAAMGGDVTPFVPARVAKRLKDKSSRR
jgi:pantetheine-phosphate adenylyltransferase